MANKANAGEYSPLGTGCPAIEQALDQLYREKSEESFWTVISTLNYAMELETCVLVPVKTAPTVYAAPAPWSSRPIPEEKAEGVPLWTLPRTRESGDRLPLFTSLEQAVADGATAGRPMAQKNMQKLFEQALADQDLEGVVINPWSCSATLDKMLLNGLLNSAPDTDHGLAELERGAEAARAGEWEQAVQLFGRSAAACCAEGAAQLGLCYYYGRGVRRSRTKALQLWKLAAENAEDVRSLVALGDDCAASPKGSAGEALLYYRRAWRSSRQKPDIDYTPEACLRIAQTELCFITAQRPRAIALAAEAAQGFRVRVRGGEQTAEPWLRQAEELVQQLTMQS